MVEVVSPGEPYSIPSSTSNGAPVAVSPPLLAEAAPWTSSNVPLSDGSPNSTTWGEVQLPFLQAEADDRTQREFVIDMAGTPGCRGAGLGIRLSACLVSLLVYTLLDTIME